MRPRTLALLFFVVAGLLAFIWFYERELPSSDERVELARRVLRLEPEEVEAVVLARGDSTVRLERLAARSEDAAGEAADAGAIEEDADEDAGWWLRQPLEAQADRWAVKALVDRLTGLEKDRTLEAADAEALGLAEPRGRITLETANGPVELLVGSPVPASSTMILAVADEDEAYVVADTLWSDLEKPGGDWRSRDLGPESREAIQRIAITGGGGVTLSRRGESFWVEAPYVDRADKDLTSDLLAGLTGLRVESFVDQAAPPPELDAGALEVVLEDREEALRIEIGGPAGAEGDLRLARVGGQLVELRTRLAEAVERPAEEWRSRSWASMQVHQIDRLEARDAAGETVFTRDGGEWLRDGARVAYEPVSELLYALTGIEAEATTAAAPPAVEPLLTLVLAGDEEERRETLRLYSVNEAGVSPARVEGREVTLLLDDGAVSDLELKLGEAREAAEPSADEGELEPLSED